MLRLKIQFQKSIKSRLNKNGRILLLPFLFLKLHTCLHRNKLLLLNLQKFCFKMLLIAVGVNRYIEFPLFLFGLLFCDIQSEGNEVFLFHPNSLDIIFVSDDNDER